MTAKVTIQDTDVVYVCVQGRLVAGKHEGRWTEVGYRVVSGAVEPHYRNGDAPEWVRELVRQAAGGKP